MYRSIKIERRHLLIVSTLLLAACTNKTSIPPVAESSPSPVEKRTACEKKFSDRVDQIVTVTGRFSLAGKLGPFIVVDGCEIYLRSDEPFDWNGHKYSRMEGRDVRVTGTLRFKDNPEVAAGPVAEARAPNHFYFDPRTSRIEMSQE